MVTRIFVLAVALSLGAADLAGNDKVFSLVSGDFASGRYIPAKHATVKVDGGRNISPSLFWKTPPKGTKSYALMCIDTHPVARRWCHWMVVNIPAETAKLPQGASGKAMPKGCVELENSFGWVGWGGPQPPRGTGVHRYVFTLYALDVSSLPVRAGAFLGENGLLKLIKGHVLGKTVLIGLFQR